MADQATTASNRKCRARNQRGQPCQSTSIGASGLCAFHDGKTSLGTAEGARRAAAKSAQVRIAKAERRKMTTVDWAAKLLEERGEEIAEIFMQAIKGGDWRAAEALMNRIYGRPKETVDLVKNEDPLGIHAMSREERQALLAEIARRERHLHAVD